MTHPVPTVEEAEAHAARVLQTHPLGTPEAGKAIDWLLCAMHECRKKRPPSPQSVSNPNGPARSNPP